VPEVYKSSVSSAVELRDKLRAARRNLMPKILESWDEVPLPLQLMDGSSPLYGYIGLDDNTLHPFTRPGAFVRMIAGIGARSGKTKQPFCFEVGTAELFALAGTWHRCKDQRGNQVRACSILTTTPNAVTANVHERMAVILDSNSCDLWLDSGNEGIGCILRYVDNVRGSLHALLSGKQWSQLRDQ
jgi:hypothetical protein